MADTIDPAPSRQEPPLPKRKLVSVRRISRIQQIQGTSLFVIHLDGWRVVQARRRPPYMVGDLVVYFEIDCFLPKDGPFWEFFSTSAPAEVFNGKEGYRVKSTRPQNQLSQGLILPLREFPEINLPFKDREREIGPAAAAEELFSKSFAELLGVVKWEFTDSAKDLEDIGPPPAFIRMSGWWRIQDVEQYIFSKHNRKKIWQITEKLDGVTMTVYKLARDSFWASCLPRLPDECPPTMQDERNRYGVCTSKQDFIDKDDNMYWQAARDSKVLERIQDFAFPNVAVQGEFCGPSIGGNTMQYPEGTHEFVVFAIWDIDKAEYLGPIETVELCNQHGLKHAPVLGYKTLKKYARNTDELLQKAEGTGEFGGVREGFVFKAVDGSDQFKVISNSWLTLTGK